MKRLILVLCLFSCSFALLTLAPDVFAQTATIGGRIVDPTGQIIGGAKVTALEIQTNASRVDVTDDTGLFRFTSLAPGPYKLTVEKDGFKALHIDDLVLTVNQIFTFEAHLELGAVSTTTVVSASTLPAIELENAQISNLVDSKRILELPLLTRDPYLLILLSPGVIQSNNGNGLNGFSANGTSQRSNNFLLDGVDNNDTDVPGAPKGLNALNPDSAQEFRVITNNFAPEYGRNTGAVIQVLTRSGTNDFHGDAYWFGRYNALGARDFFNPAVNGPQNPYTRNDFGASAGGPIRKDKAFWFVNYEGQRFITTLTGASTVPTSGFKTGVFKEPDPTIAGQMDTVDISTNVLGYSLDPTMKKILAFYPNPSPNGPVVTPGISGTLFYPSASRLQSDTFTVKTDYQLWHRHQLSLRYSFNQANDPNFDHSDFLPNDLGATSLYLRNQNASIGLTSTLSERWINEFHFGGNRSNQQYGCDGSKTFDSFGQIDSVGTGADYGIPFGKQGPNGYNGFGCYVLTDANAQARFTGTYQTLDSMTYSRGRHLFKWGAEFRDVYSNSFDDYATRASLDFRGYSNSGVIALPATSPFVNDPVTEDAVLTLLGFVDTQSQSQYFDKQQKRSATDLRGFRQREWAGFVQDAWKLLPNLTATYGLRYEYYGVPFEVNNNLSNLFEDPSAAAPPGGFIFSIVGPGTGQTLYNNQYKNFEPRIGLAWDPFKNGRTSVRAGYGIFHDRAYGNLLGNSRGNPPFSLTAFNYPYEQLTSLMPPGQVPPLDPSNPLAVPDNSYQYVTLIDPNLKTPNSQNWNFGLQHAITPTLTLEANYVGVKGSHLFRVVDGNPPQPGLVQNLVQYCSVPNAYDCVESPTQSTLQNYILWYGASAINPATSMPYIPYNAVNNLAFYASGGPGAFLYKSIGSSIYHGMQMNLQKQFTHGLQFQVAYTYSHAISDVNDPLVPGVGNANLPHDSFNLKAERGNSDFDIRHRAVINFIYEPNVGRGRGHFSEGFTGRVLEGWALSGIIDAQTGHPFDVYGLTDSNHTGEYTRVTRIGSISQPSGTDKTFTGPAASGLETTPFDVASNIGKNAFYGPGLVNFDVAVLKDNALTEKVKLQFRLEVFNLFNHAQFVQPENFFGTGIADFGQSSATLTRPDGTTSARQMQVALKLIF